MTRARSLTIAFAVLFLATFALAGEPTLDLVVASGIVDKADKDSVTIQPRGKGGKFGKEVTLKITGTSKITIVTQEKRGKNLVPVQRDAQAKDLEARQAIAVIFAGGSEPVLLSAVAQKAK